MKKTYQDQPGFKGNSYRGTGQRDMVDYITRLEKYKANKAKIVTEDMFFSSSTSRNFANGWDNARPYRIEFTIKGKSGVCPNGLELSAAEAEILFNSKTQFKVIDVVENVNVPMSYLGSVPTGAKYQKVAHIILEEI